MVKLKNYNLQEQKIMINKANVTIKEMKDCLSLKKIHEPMRGGRDPEGMDPEIGLNNPYSKVTCFILYLYSMEFGTPPLYSELNRVAREMDLS